jgi:hypothetical protein
MSTGPLPISDVVQVNVSAATTAIAPESFNQGLIIGASDHIPTVGANARLRQYPNLAAMLADNFSDSDPEFLAAELYFGQSALPSEVWIGRRDLTAISAAVPDGREVTDGAMDKTTDPTHLGSASAAFVSGDVGSVVIVMGAGAGGADLITTIASVSSGTLAILSEAALTTVSAAKVYIGAFGVGFSPNEVVNVTSGGTGGQLKVLTVGPDGQVLTLGTITGNQGTAFSVEDGLTTAAINTRSVADAIMNDVVLTDYVWSATANFTAADVGKAIVIQGAGLSGAPLIAKIIAFKGLGFGGNPTQPAVQVSKDWLTSVGAATATIGASQLKVNVTAIGESYLQALEACQNFNQPWYGFMCCGATDQDHLDLAEYSNANWETMLYFGSTADADVPAGTPANIALQLQALSYKALLMYSTTQGGLYPHNIYAAAAILGLASGLNTGLASSYFTLNLKKVSGVAPEALTQTQYATILAAGCNACVTIGPYEGYFTNGKLESGDFFDQILFRAMLVNEIQINLVNVLTSTPAVPQTNAGEHQLISQVDAACANLASIGYIGPGTWTGGPVLNLATGQVLPQGYLDQAQSYAFRSAGDRAARKSMPIYCCILEAGAVHSVVVQVNVQL